MSVGILHEVGNLLLAPGFALGWAFPKAAFPALLLCCSGGLKQAIWAFGFGYGLCMLTGGILTWTQLQGSPWFCGLYVCYGLRLVMFLYRRQSSSSFCTSTHGQDVNAKAKRTKMSGKVMACLIASLSQLSTLYALQPLGVADLPPVSKIGLIISALGLLLEATADEQKLAAKELAPDEPVLTGAYNFVRHPNYLGEVLFWFGILMAGQISLPSGISWASRMGYALGPMCMIWIMFKAAKRLDKANVGKYKDNTDYQVYLIRTPSMTPTFRKRSERETNAVVP